MRGFKVHCLSMLAALSLLGTASLRAETVLITGSNSGLGLELARQYAQKGWKVIATHRRDTEPEELVALRRTFPAVSIERMDVTNAEQISALVTKLGGSPIDVLINNAGVMTLDNWKRGVGVGQRFGDLDFSTFDPIMDINVKGTMMVTQALIGNVRASRQGKVIAITSSHGSIADPPPTTVNALWYGASKAALNKLMSVVARVVEKDNVIVVPIHPGSVRVDGGTGPLPAGMIEAPFAVGKIIATIDGLTMASTGKFLRYDGVAIAW